MSFLEFEVLAAEPIMLVKGQPRPILKGDRLDNF